MMYAIPKRHWLTIKPSGESASSQLALYHIQQAELGTSSGVIVFWRILPFGSWFLVLERNL
ncbi:hypothetical protein D9757_006178 [Collybiopsis confluens]|uniref:Uncharacterized protein n=1 Tax=Collybiopsis confluens TaxID=2823264 RepID=A0A8H5HHG0_9AGAR|nr:hypothetical protein D9757_006178 [Collybiopsis confluens]